MPASPNDRDNIYTSPAVPPATPWRFTPMHNSLVTDRAGIDAPSVTMSSFVNKSVIRPGSAKADRLLNNERSPNGAQDETDYDDDQDDLKIVENDEDCPPVYDGTDDEAVPLTSPNSSVRKHSASDALQHFLKPRRSNTQPVPHGNDRDDTEFNVSQGNLHKVMKLSPSDGAVMRFGNFRPDSSSLLSKVRSASKSSPSSELNLDPVHHYLQHHSRIDFRVPHKGHAGGTTDGESQSRGENQNRGSTGSALPPFTQETGQELSFFKDGGRQPRAGREGDDDVVAEGMGGWSTLALGQHRLFSDLVEGKLFYFYFTYILMEITLTRDNYIEWVNIQITLTRR
ncbi:hypothetical protein Btru_033646 [Bulinus truncatus]|nr:hypothetical protein Btru_033646 [Bulinus truncatus]